MCLETLRNYSMMITDNIFSNTAAWYMTFDIEIEIGMVFLGLFIAKPNDFKQKL